jgi:hypothetical protein
LYQQADIINKTTINIQYFYKEESQWQVKGYHLLISLKRY